MELDRLIADLSESEAWGGRPVDVRQTHISVVFLAGDRAFKLKKPVSLGFLDFSTPELRERFCEEEVRLNRRLAPDVYLGVRPVGLVDGRARVGAEPAVDHVVEMARLPDGATLEALLDGVDEDAIAEVGRWLAAFHASAERGPQIARWGGLDVVAGNARENFAQSRGQVGAIVDAGVFERLGRATEAALADRGPLIAARAERGVPCDTHGDLHLDHVYRIDGRWVAIDCIEFNERFRFADPVADVAFLAMDLGFHGRDDLAAALRDAWIAASGDEEGRALFPVYQAYRAAVRAKVAGMKAAEPEVGEDARAAAAEDARAHWLFALAELVDPSERPALIGVGGLPGTGKSTLARGLGEAAGFEVVRSDVVRKELAGLRPEDSGKSPFGAGIYTDEWTERTYEACFRRAADVIAAGGRCIVDATFREQARRDALFDLGRRCGVRTGLILCEASVETATGRLDRRVGNASDADRGVYERAAERWEPVTGLAARRTRIVRTDGPKEQSRHAGLVALRELGFLRDSGGARSRPFADPS